jgi:hypothetical protein
MIEGFELIERLGAGAMGEVHRARQTALDREVALKILHRGADLDPTFERRFRREAQIQSGLAHPNLVRVLDAGISGETRWLAMELVRGHLLTRYIDRPEPLPLEFALAAAAQIADGLAYLHEHEIVHRDLKPSNVLVSETGTVKVADFGLARAAGSTLMTGAGQIVGTLAYMAPETVAGETAGPPADVYALGLLLYELISGKPPYTAENLGGWLAAILNAKPAPLAGARRDVPAAVDRLALALLAKDAGERPAAGAVRDVLAAHAPADARTFAARVRELAEVVPDARTGAWRTEVLRGRVGEEPAPLAPYAAAARRARGRGSEPEPEPVPVPVPVPPPARAAARDGASRTFRTFAPLVATLALGALMALATSHVLRRARDARLEPVIAQLFGGTAAARRAAIAELRKADGDSARATGALISALADPDVAVVADALAAVIARRAAPAEYVAVLAPRLAGAAESEVPLLLEPAKALPPEAVAACLAERAPGPGMWTLLAALPPGGDHLASAVTIAYERAAPADRGRALEALAALAPGAARREVASALRSRDRAAVLAAVNAAARLTALPADTLAPLRALVTGDDVPAGRVARRLLEERDASGSRAACALFALKHGDRGERRQTLLMIAQQKRVLEQAVRDGIDGAMRAALTELTARPDPETAHRSERALRELETLAGVPLIDRARGVLLRARRARAPLAADLFIAGVNLTDAAGEPRMPLAAAGLANGDAEVQRHCAAALAILEPRAAVALDAQLRGLLATLLQQLDLVDGQGLPGNGDLTRVGRLLHHTDLNEEKRQAEIAGAYLVRQVVGLYRIDLQLGARRRAAIVRGLSDASWTRFLAVREMLTSMERESLIDVLGSAARAADVERLLSMLALQAGANDLNVLEKLGRHPASKVRVHVARELGLAGADADLRRAQLRVLIGDRDPEVRRTAIAMMAAAQPDRAKLAAELDPWRADANAAVRRACEAGLEIAPDRARRGALLDDPSPALRQLGLTALLDDPGVPADQAGVAVKKAAGDPDLFVVRIARQALGTARPNRE